MAHIRTPNLFRPYRLLPFWIKHPVRQAIGHLSYLYWTKVTVPRSYNPEQVRREIGAFAYKPKISIAMPVYNTPTRFLDSAIRSVRKQYYKNWELCISDDASSDSAVRSRLQRWQKRDRRIKVVYSIEHEHISGASNRALALATGEFIGLLDHDDEITPDALFENVKLLQQHPDADMIYSDEDKLDPKGRTINPVVKPDWSPQYMLKTMYTCHFGVYRKALIDDIGGFRKGFEGSQDYDLVLRLSEKTNRIYHISKILYHWRIAPGSAAGSVDAKPYANAAAKRAIAEHLERRCTPGTVLDGDQPGTYIVIFEPQDSGATIAKA